MEKQNSADAELLAEAMERYELCVGACNEQYETSKHLLEFAAGKQWSDADRRKRGKRPTITVNRLAAPLDQVKNAQRQNRTQIKVFPIDNDSDPDTAQIINGIIRHSLNYGNASAAIDTAFDHQVTGGIGYVRVVTEFESDDSNNQVIVVKRVDNPFRVLVPMHLIHELDFSDMPYCFITEDVDRGEFEKEYGETNPLEWTGEGAGSWFTDKTIRVCEYYKVETTTRRKYFYNELPSGSYDKLEGIEPVAERDVEIKNVKWYKLCGGKVLEQTDVPGKYIPVVPFLGKETLFANGNRIYQSLITHAVAPQELYNAMKSNTSALLSKASRGSYIAAIGQLDGGLKAQWSRSSVEDIPVLEYHPISASGAVLPAPRITEPMPIPTGLVNATMAAADEIKQTTGIHDASMGAQGNESSGRAIVARQRQGDASNVHFHANKDISMRHIGRICLSWIPVYYDVQRAARVLGDDMTEKIVMLNQQSENGKLYDVTVGSYDVVIDTAPSAVSRRNEIGELLVKFAQSDPVVMESSRDQVARFLDLPNEIVERLSRTIKPEIKGDGGDDPQAELAAEKQRSAQLEAVVKELDSAIQKMDEHIKELEGKNEIEEKKIAASLAETKMKVEADLTKTKINNAHSVGMEAISRSDGLNGDALNALIDAINILNSRLEAVEGSAQTAIGYGPAPFAENV